MPKFVNDKDEIFKYHFCKISFSHDYGLNINTDGKKFEHKDCDYSPPRKTYKVS